MYTKFATAAILLALLAVPGTSLARSVGRDAIAASNSWVPYPQERIIGTDPDVNVRFEMRRDPSNNR